MTELKKYAGIDIGGSFIKYGIVTDTGAVLFSDKCPTDRTKPKRVLDDLADIIRQLKQDYGIDRVGISIPGVINQENQLVTSGAIQDLYKYDVSGVLSEKTQTQVQLVNDANAVAYAEKWIGAGENYDNFVCLPLGTGVGGAIFINGELVRGRSGAAGEFGMTLMGVGKTEPVGYESASFYCGAVAGLCRIYNAKMGIKIFADWERDITVILNFAEAGQVEAQESLAEFYQNTAVLLLNISVSIDPELIIIGGGISENTTIMTGIKTAIKQLLVRYSDMSAIGFPKIKSFTGKEEAEMTQNNLGLKIEINMSNDDHYLDRIFDYQPNRQQLVGCHNFFPQAFTGLSVDYFVHCSKRFLERNLQTAAFVTSQVGEVGPWSLHEGLCTLEAHRHLPIESQVKHLKFLNVVDDIIIGNAYASEDELEKMSQAFYADVLSLSVDPESDVTELEKTIIEETVHTYRGDRSECMIRSSMPRFTYYTTSIPEKGDASVIKRGDVLILNETYGQYKGEVQIALKDRPKDVRVNKVGRICEADLILLDAVKPYTSFLLQFL